MGRGTAAAGVDIIGKDNTAKAIGQLGSTNAAAATEELGARGFIKVSLFGAREGWNMCWCICGWDLDVKGSCVAAHMAGYRRGLLMRLSSRLLLLSSIAAARCLLPLLLLQSAAAAVTCSCNAAISRTRLFCIAAAVAALLSLPLH